MKFLLHIFCYIPAFLLRSLRINMSILRHKFVYNNCKVTQASLLPVHLQNDKNQDSWKVTSNTFTSIKQINKNKIH